MFRLVRNIPAEKYLLGHAEPYAPRYDVEEIDAARIPIRVLGTAMRAPEAKELLGRAALEAAMEAA